MSRNRLEDIPWTCPPGCTDLHSPEFVCNLLRISLRHFYRVTAGLRNKNGLTPCPKLREYLQIHQP